MRARILAILLAVLFLLPAASVATSDVPPTTYGWKTACVLSPQGGPCKGVTVSNGLDVPTGETHSYTNGTYIIDGTIHVQPGGTLVMRNATILFTSNSEGIVALAGSFTNITQTGLGPSSAGVPFGISVAATAHLAFTKSTLVAGKGIALASDDAEISGSLLREIPLALHLQNVSVVIHDNEFLNNTVAVNETGGQPTLRSNLFQGGSFCVRDWLSDPSIVGNTFHGCAVGIWHERSESLIGGNTMDDDFEPPGTGIFVVDTQSPIIENNDISRYGHGIVIQNARGFIRNNTIHDNVAEGVLVTRNSLAMDIQGNAIHHNGGAGIALRDAHDIVLATNQVYANGGNGIEVVRSTFVSSTGDAATGNAGNGVVLDHASNFTGTSLAAKSNGLDGVNVTGGTGNSLTRANASGNARNGYAVAGDGTGGLVISFDSLVAMRNANDGLFSASGSAVYAQSSWWEGNARAGVENADPASALVVPKSYWGSATGPTAPDNPLGRGDRVIGNVVYQPFLITPPPGAA